MTFRRFLDLLLFRAYADLRAERQRTYLGFLWWVFEPLLFMIALWVAFDVILNRGGEGFVFFVLVGLVIWQWFKACVSHSSNTLIAARKITMQVALPPVLFPLVMILTDTIKFSLVLFLLLAILLVSDRLQTGTLVALPAVLLVELAMVLAASIWVAAIVPFMPDVRLLTETVLTALMFLSGIFYSGARLPEPIRTYFFLNPVAFIIEQGRTILLEGRWPDWGGLLLVLVLSSLIAAGGAWFMHRLRHHYPKLPV